MKESFGVVSKAASLPFLPRLPSAWSYEPPARLDANR